MATATRHSPPCARAGGGGRGCGESFLPSTRRDFSIRFNDKAKIRGIAFRGMEKGPLPRMQHFSIIVTDKKHCRWLKQFSSSKNEFLPFWSWKFTSNTWKTMTISYSVVTFLVLWNCVPSTVSGISAALGGAVLSCIIAVSSAPANERVPDVASRCIYIQRLRTLANQQKTVDPERRQSKDIWASSNIFPFHGRKRRLPQSHCRLYSLEQAEHSNPNMNKQHRFAVLINFSSIGYWMSRKGYCTGRIGELLAG